MATSTLIAAGAGLDILKKGGNAVDGVIATAACLTVVEPTGCGIGGDAYALVWIEKEKKLYGLNSSGFAPEKMKLEEYAEERRKLIGEKAIEPVCGDPYSPGFLCKNNEAMGAFGVMGAFMQPQGQIQVLTNLIDFHMNPQEALDAPRWQWIKGKEIQIESGVNEEIVDGLREKGHEVTVMEDFTNMGKGQVILRQPDSGGGSYVCATEKRCDGYVATW